VDKENGNNRINSEKGGELGENRQCWMERKKEHTAYRFKVSQETLNIFSRKGTTGKGEQSLIAGKPFFDNWRKLV